MLKCGPSGAQWGTLGSVYVKREKSLLNVEIKRITKTHYLKLFLPVKSVLSVFFLPVLARKIQLMENDN